MIARCAVIAFSGAMAVAATAHADLRVAQSRFPGGLTVILAPDDSASSVAVHVRYAFGTADQAPGEDGFAHLVELLLSAGTSHASDPDTLLDDAGGWATTTTTTDHVGVTDVVPAGALELALWIEADRMAGLADALDDARLARAVAKLAAERDSAYVDHPSALVARAVQLALWQGDRNAALVLGDAHPTVAALGRFIRARVVPAGATLVIAGRFDPSHARTLAERYFRWIPAGRPPAAGAARPVPRAAAARREVPDPIAKVVVAARTDVPDSPDELALEVAGQIVASQLGRRLGAAANDVHVDVIRQARGGELRIAAAAAGDPAGVEAAIASELQRLADTAVDAEELARARATVDARLITGLESLAFRAERLAGWAAYTGRADRLDDSRIALGKIDPAAVQRAVRRWLAPSALVTVVGTGAP